MAAVQRGDRTTYEQCEFANHPIDAQNLRDVAAGSWILDQAAVAEPTSCAVACPTITTTSNAVTYLIPAPPTPGDTLVGEGTVVVMPPHQSGMYVTVDLVGDIYLVTDVVLYAST